MQALNFSKLVWVTLPSGTAVGAQVRFPDVSELRGKRILGLEFYASAVLAATPDRVAVVSAADAVNYTLVLKDASDERHQDIPLLTLYPLNTGGIWKQVTPFVVNWQSSFVRVVGAPAASPVSIPLGIFYE